MQDHQSTKFAAAIADRMIAERFGRAYGVYSFAAYLDFVYRRATVHLDDHLAQRVMRTAGRQRRKARLTIENAGTVIIAVPLNDCRTGQTIWAETEFDTWLNLIEVGADNAWVFIYKRLDQRAGQVCTSTPIRSSTSTDRVAIARLIANAKPGMQARTLDRNALNLRRGNVFLIGNPNTSEGWVGRAKTNAVNHMKEQAALRQSLAGRAYMAGHGESVEV